MQIESIGFTVTAPGASGTAATAVAGDSLVIKSSKNPRIGNFWYDAQLGGWVQIVFPTAHDTTRGMGRYSTVASEVTPRLAMGLPQSVTPQEALSITTTGSVTAGDVENGCLLMMYDELPGISQRLLTWAQVVARMESLTTLQFTIDVTAGGAWNGSELISADSDLLRANRDYAILGIEFAVECCAVSIKGPDTGNLRVAVPGSIEFADLSNQWFAMLSRSYGEPMIPVINSANKSSTFLEALQDENIADVTGSVIMALLK